MLFPTNHPLASFSIRISSTFVSTIYVWTFYLTIICFWKNNNKFTYSSLKKSDNITDFFTLLITIYLSTISADYKFSK